MGQGLHTKVRQIAAQTLGLPLSSIRVMPTRTDKIPNTSATAASSGADLNGAAVKIACETLVSRLSPSAAQLLGPTVAPEDVVFENGRAHAVGHPEHSVPFTKVVTGAYLARVSLSATGYYRTPHIHFDKAAGKGSPFSYFAYGASVSEVEVDGLTGQCRLLRVDLLHDAGDPLNPLVDRGQVEGGFVQGMGWLTMEELVWDEAGRLRTYAPSTYKIPTAADVPEAFHARLLTRAAEPGAVLGGKAVGEPPLMLALSVREAIRDAVGAFGPPDSREPVALASPATPEAILRAVGAVKVRLEPAKVSNEAVPAD